MAHPLDDVAETPWGRRVTDAIDLTQRQMDEAASKREIDIRFTGLTDALEKLEKNISTRFEHTERMFQLTQDAAKRAVDKAEAAQAAHNVAANEWRGTLNDFKVTLVSRSEFERFYSEFSAYRLEQSRQMSLSAGAKQEKMESKEDWKSIAAILISVATAIGVFLTRHA